MTILLVQTFLLMLGAFLLGTTLACLIRRAFSRGREVAAPASSPSLAGVSAPSAPVGVPKAADTDRFGRALAGGQGPAVPPVFQGEPVVEVQPPPAAPPAPPVALVPPDAPTPKAAPVVAPAPPAAPPPVVQQSPPEPPVAAPAPSPEPEPEQSFEPSYAAIAVTVAAAAIAKAKEEFEAEQAAEAAKKAAASTVSVQEAVVAPEEATAASRFGTPVADALPPQPAASEPVDDLTRIRAIDGNLKERLIRLGVHRFAAIAAWMPSDVNRISQSLGFQGRIEQENWIEQAQILAKGGDTDYSRKREEVAPVDMAAPMDGERLHRIIGIDPKSEALLHANGVVSLAHIAAWTAADIERFEGLLGAQGRIGRENWVEQARFLTGGAAPAEDAPEAPSSASPATASASSVFGSAVSVPSQPRSEGYAGLRSVRSEALRGEGSGLAGGPSSGEIDDLKRIRGIGVLIEKKLNSLGITAYEQIANWTGADIDRISQLLDFKGRIERENWIEQARILASGGQTEFSRRADRTDA